MKVISFKCIFHQSSILTDSKQLKPYLINSHNLPTNNFLSSINEHVYFFFYFFFWINHMDMESKLWKD